MESVDIIEFECTFYGVLVLKYTNPKFNRIIMFIMIQILFAWIKSFKLNHFFLLCKNTECPLKSVLFL